MTASPAPGPAKTLPLTACGFSHAGRQREENEDAFGSFIDARLFIVADGMGGHNAGEVASVMAVDALETFFRSYHADPRQPWPHVVDTELSLGANLLRVGIKVANDKIRAAAKQDRAKNRMGTTIVALAVGDAQLTIAHAGDSRAYRLRGDEIRRLTRDHSIVEEMLAARPEMTDDEIAAFAHRNVVTRSLGSKETIEPTVLVEPLEPGDLFLVCSDGLWGSVPDPKMKAILRSTSDIEAACQLLIDAANEAGGPDNITSVLVKVG
ncbi:MAG TPA: PP2C family serine/threonine-protein phosphatase [Polyangia bacterium]|jgi:protein phosphatase|nr:PP2C family serine/threonine-protein phosphatase [Polyangia bacterium]